MIDVTQYRTEGFLYDSLKNYTNLIDFDKFKEIKSFIDEKEFKRHSKYDYWFKYKDLSYMEEIVYDKLLKNDKDLKTADYVYEMAHRYQIKKIEECGFYPTWVFGTSLDDEISGKLNNGIISDFQKNFAKHYYSERNYENFEQNIKLQFYDKDCLIDLHDDGKPENRICVFLYFLNNEWDESNGGRLILYDVNENPIPVHPTFPNFVVLDSDINLFHKVEKVLNDTKYNIVSFYSHK